MNHLDHLDDDDQRRAISTHLDALGLRVATAAAASAARRREQERVRHELAPLRDRPSGSTINTWLD